MPPVNPRPHARLPAAGVAVRRRVAVPVAAAGLVIALLGPPGTAGAVTPAACDGHPVTITGTDGDDVLVGTPGADVIAALDGADIINGRGGDDIICAGDGGDVLRGGPGDDRLFGEEDGEGYYAGDDLIGGAGDDYLDAGIEIHYDRILYRDEPVGIHADLQAGLVVTSRGTDTIVRPTDISFYGSRYADVVEGSDGPDEIFGRGGDDTLNGGGHQDRIYGDRGDDLINGGPGSDHHLSGGAGDDVIDSVDNGTWVVVDGGPGDDHLIGTPYYDTHLGGGPGDDLIEGRGYNDKMRGGGGNDTIDGGPGSDIGIGNNGTDACISIENPRQCERPTTGS